MFDRDQCGSSTLPTWQFSDLIGAIYDCAIDPDIWPQTIEKICGALRCICGLIEVIDLQRSQILFAKAWNFDWSRAAAYADDIQYHLGLQPILSQPIDKPWSLARLIPAEQAMQAMESPYFNGVAAPEGYVDSIQTIVFRNAVRIGMFAAGRHKSVSFATDDDLAILRMLAPHVRRAVTIGNLLGMKALEAQALAATLNTLAAGVIVVAADHSVLFANTAADRTLAAGRPIQSVRGKLRAVAADAWRAFEGHCAGPRRRGDIGKVGIGISLQATGGGEPVIAHVLPLARGDIRARLLPQREAVEMTESLCSNGKERFTRRARGYRNSPLEPERSH